MWLCHLLFVKRAMPWFKSLCDILTAVVLFTSNLNLGGGHAKHPTDLLCELTKEAGFSHLCFWFIELAETSSPFHGIPSPVSESPRSPGPVTATMLQWKEAWPAEQVSLEATGCKPRPLQLISSAAIWHKYIQMLKTYCRLRLHLQPQGKANNYF